MPTCFTSACLPSCVSTLFEMAIPGSVSSKTCLHAAAAARKNSPCLRVHTLMPQLQASACQGVLAVFLPQEPACQCCIAYTPRTYPRTRKTDSRFRPCWDCPSAQISSLSPPQSLSGPCSSAGAARPATHSAKSKSQYRTRKYSVRL